MQPTMIICFRPEAVVRYLTTQKGDTKKSLAEPGIEPESVCPNINNQTIGRFEHKVKV